MMDTELSLKKGDVFFGDDKSKPRNASLKLLHLVERKGIGILN